MFLSGKFNPEDEEEMINISKMPNLYQSIAESMAPAKADGGCQCDFDQLHRVPLETGIDAISRVRGARGVRGTR